MYVQLLVCQTEDISSNENTFQGQTKTEGIGNNQGDIKCPQNNYEHFYLIIIILMVKFTSSFSSTKQSIKIRTFQDESNM